MKETIEQYHASKFEVRWLNEEKVAQNADIAFLKTTYTQLQGELRAQTYILESNKQKLAEIYSHIDFLKEEVAELKGAREALRGELRMSKEEMRAAKEEVESSHLRMTTLKNYSQVFQTEFRIFVSLIKKIRDKLSLTMSNLYIHRLLGPKMLDNVVVVVVGTIVLRKATYQSLGDLCV